MDVAEDVVLRPGAGNGEKELLATQISVQIGVCRAMGNEEVDDGNLLFRAGHYAIPQYILVLSAPGA